MDGLKVALFCPGQASQYVGMARSLADRFPSAAEVLQRADRAVEFDLLSLCFDGPAETLSLTEFQQPCVLAATVAAITVFRESLPHRSVCAAGHSLGEYSALVAAHSFSLEDAVRLVYRRGQLMQKAVEPGKGAMLALIGRGAIDAQGLCEAVSNGDDACWPANYNAPNQIVISGLSGAVERARQIAREYGVRRAIPLNVSAPFHTPLMRPAADTFAKTIADVPISAPSFDVYSNVDACVHAPDPDAIRRALVKQIYSPVLFDKIGQQIAQRVHDGIAVECGPGHVLTGLMGSIASTMRIYPFGEEADVHALQKAVS